MFKCGSFICSKVQTKHFLIKLLYKFLCTQKILRTLFLTFFWLERRPSVHPNQCHLDHGYRTFEPRHSSPRYLSFFASLCNVLNQTNSKNSSCKKPKCRGAQCRGIQVFYTRWRDVQQSRSFVLVANLLFLPLFSHFIAQRRTSAMYRTFVTQFKI